MPIFNLQNITQQAVGGKTFAEVGPRLLILLFLWAAKLKFEIVDYLGVFAQFLLNTINIQSISRHLDDS